MNTHGSYRCYCEPGYTLGADAYTCTRDATCSSLRCQFACQMERGGAVGCLCPPGLHLAADNKTCEAEGEAAPRLADARPSGGKTGRESTAEVTGAREGETETGRCRRRKVAVKGTDFLEAED
ncbi:hypothetical protein Q5P01_025379 [Channa striata]|uniref:EGF-like domain-containing protein n=1 Tax=Channa striata TaxID=64152 RepID=A0AA88IWM9_CHASR|nr:hypothetical protein Q5P01_025379 [Channa striata]